MKYILNLIFNFFGKPKKNLGYSLFLDDFRAPVDAFNYTKDIDFNLLKWTTVRNYKEFVEYITKMHEVGYFPQVVAFDHDLAEGHYHKNMQEEKMNYASEDFNDDDNKTGYHCAKWLVDFCITNKLKFPEYKVHSMNPVGKENIKSYIESAKRHTGI
jgi:hypothetical protein